MRKHKMGTHQAIDKVDNVNFQNFQIRQVTLEEVLHNLS